MSCTLGSLEQKALDCADGSSKEFEEFLKLIEPARGPKDADTQQDLDNLTAKICNITVSEASIYLNGKGLMKVRRDRGLQRNIYFYQYAFSVDGKKEKPQFMKLRKNDT